MRKTIFRGLNKKGEWVYGDLVNCVGIKHMPKQNTKTWIVTSAFGNGGWFNIRLREYVLPDTVGQFTGLKDKNGVGIFEGDIITAGIRGGNVLSTYSIKYDSTYGCWYGDLIKSQKLGNKDCMAIGELRFNAEVIGNIHQNPELIKD